MQYEAFGFTSLTSLKAQRCYRARSSSNLHVRAIDDFRIRRDGRKASVGRARLRPSRGIARWRFYCAALFS